MSAKKAQNEVGVLLCEVKVEGFIIKPWSFGVFKKVFGPLVYLLRPLKEMGLDLDNIETFFMKNGLEVLLLLPDALNSLTAIIAVTLSISEEEVDAINPEKILLIATTIFSQNIERLKNSLPLVMAQIQAVTRAT